MVGEGDRQRSSSQRIGVAAIENFVDNAIAIGLNGANDAFHELHALSGFLAQFNDRI
jgi:hypothetical protein